MKNVRKQQGSVLPAVHAASRVIRDQIAFSEFCVPDRRTGKEPYRIGWGRSVGRFNGELAALESDEKQWLEATLLKLLQNADRTLRYEVLTQDLVDRFLDGH